MREKIIVGLILSFLVISCGPKKPTIDELKAEKHCKDSISLIEQKKSLSYYDSIHQTLLPRVDSMLTLFDYEKNEQYEDHGTYILRRLKTTLNPSRNYLQAYVMDNCQTFVQCFYYGNSPLQINQITLMADSISDHFSGATHSFEAGGFHETMTISGDDAVRLLHFIDSYSEARIRVSLEGTKGRSVFYLTQPDKESLIQTLQLGTLLHDVRELENQVQNTSIQVQKYQKRLEKDK